MKSPIIFILVAIFFVKVDLSEDCSNIEDCPKNCTCNPYKADCRGQKLHSIPPASSDTKFQELDLSENKLSELKNTSFVGYHSTRKLKLRFNRIQKIESHTFSKMKMLEVLDMSFNYIDFIPGDLFSQNQKLESVSLRHNWMIEFPPNDMFLTNLDLSYNKISQISNNKEIHVRNIDISSNLFEKLSNDDIRALQVDSINVMGNPWKCGPDFINMLCWNLNKSISERKPISCLTNRQDKREYTTSLQNKLCTIFVRRTTNMISSMSNALTEKDTTIIGLLTSLVKESNTMAKDNILQSTTQAQIENIDTNTDGNSSVWPVVVCVVSLIFIVVVFYVVFLNRLQQTCRTGTSGDD
ncbi:hypothetical protein C0J52_11442 [Blattella germanica]|nr:hypothetical protein C0J52_11442 [Blattella germanica]